MGKITVDVPDGEYCVGCDFLKDDKCLVFKDTLFPAQARICNVLVTEDYYKHPYCLATEKKDEATEK